MKKFMKLVPAILLETLLFGLILLGIGVYASKAVYGEKAIGEIKVGVVAKGEDKLADMLLQFVESMDSVKDTVTFARLSEAEAREGLETGEIYGVIIIPEGMVDSIISGENIPAKILLGNSYSRAETEVFAQLTKAGAKILATAQAGIYAADALCMENGRKDALNWTENYLNEAYLGYALERTTLFREKEVRALSSVGLGDYYGIALLLAFLSFAGLAFGRYMQVEMGERERLISCRGLGRTQQYLIETAAFSSAFALLGVLISLPVYMLLIKQGGSSFKIAWTWGWLAVIWLSAGIFIRAVIQIFGNHAAGIGISFVILMFMMTGSGIFVPSAFLPLWMARAGRYMPYQIWMEGMGVILQGRFEGIVAGRILVLALVFLLAGMLVPGRKSWGNKKHWRLHGREEKDV